MPRSQILVISIVILGVFAAVFALRQKAMRGAGVLAGASGDYERGTTRARRGNYAGMRVRASTGENTGANSVRRPTRIIRISETQRREDFEAQKFRAWGESSVFGHVRGEDGKPMPGVRMQLFEGDPMTRNPPLREVATDQEGSYTLQELNSGGIEFIIAARAEGFVPEAQVIAIHGPPVRRDFRLIRGVAVSGVVRDARTSEPISGAAVYHPSPGGGVFGLLGSISSGPAGQFAFPNVRPGPVRILAEREGYHHTLKLVRAPTSEAEIAMEPGGASIRGTTVNRRTRKAEGGARVVVRADGFEDSVVSSEADGSFEFRELPAGKYTVFAVKGTKSDKQELVLRDREVRDSVEIVLPADLFVSGKVVNANEGYPMPGVRIYYDSPSGSKTSIITDENGLFGFETFVVSEYSLEVHEKNFLPVFETKTTGSAERITRKILASAASDVVLIRLRPVPCVEGTVRREVKGKPGGPAWGVDVAVAYLQGNSFERKITQTDVNGSFFVNLPEKKRGYAKVTVHEGSNMDLASLRIPTRKRLELVLRPTRMIAELLLVDKTPLSGIRVATSYLFPDGRPPEKSYKLYGKGTFVNAGGRFVLPVPASNKEKTVLTFDLPDGKVVQKTYRSRTLRRRKHVFIYDPVTGDIISDIREGPDTPRQRATGSQPATTGKPPRAEKPRAGPGTASTGK